MGSPLPRLAAITAALGVAALAAAAVGPASAGTTTLPLGDGHTTTTSPQVGWIYACKIITGGGGAVADVPWITGDTWNPSEKISVAGSNTWPTASVKVATSGAVRTITTSGIPRGATTGNFPVATTDPAYVYDRNPNTVAAKTVAIQIPRTPRAAADPGCLSLGAVGYALNGVAIFNGLDGENRDAAAHEVLDSCDGHPERTGQYHYHNGSACLTAKTTGKRSTLIGYALDGYGIYLERDTAGNLLTNAALDVCHGRMSAVVFNGKRQKMYHYVITAEYPYTLGCYHGTPLAATLAAVSATSGPTGGGTGGSAPQPSATPGPVPAPSGSSRPLPPPPPGR